MATSPSNSSFIPLTGHCTCKTITYTLLAVPLFTNCCHCTWCQRETGSAFVLNSIIESSNFLLTSPIKPLHINVPTASGDGQMMARCPVCYVVVYSDYGDDARWTTFVRAGTLDEGSRGRVRPDAHIWTGTKVGWVDLEGERGRGVPIFEERYRRVDVWGAEANERFEVLRRRMAEAETETETGEISKT